MKRPSFFVSGFLLRKLRRPKFMKENPQASCKLNCNFGMPFHLSKKATLNFCFQLALLGFQLATFVQLATRNFYNKCNLQLAPRTIGSTCYSQLARLEQLAIATHNSHFTISPNRSLSLLSQNGPEIPSFSELFGLQKEKHL